MEEEAPGWCHWRWSEGTTMPAIGVGIDLDDAIMLTEKFPEPRACLPFFGGMWLSYHSQEVLLTLPRRKGSDPSTPITICAGILGAGSIERAAGRRPYMCSGGTTYTTFCEEGVLGTLDSDIIGITARVWGTDLLDLPGRVQVVVQQGAGPPGGPLMRANSTVWFAPTSPYVGGVTRPSPWDDVSGHGVPVSASDRALRVAKRVIADRETEYPWSDNVDSLLSDFRKGERPGITRKGSLENQEVGDDDVFRGSAKTAPLAWLRNSKSPVDRAVGSILRGFEGPSKLIWALVCSPYIVWRGLGGSSLDHTLVEVLVGTVVMLVVASFGVCNRSIGRAISPFKRRFDPMFAVVAVGATASSLSAFVFSALSGKAGGALNMLDLMVSVYILGLYSVGNSRDSRPADAHEWRDTCLRHGVEFAEVGMPLKISRSAPDEMERDYAGTIGGSPWTAAIHARRPSWQGVPYLTVDGWELYGQPLDNDQVFAESGGRDRRKDAWLAAFISATLMDPAGSISEAGARRRLSAVLILLAQNAEEPPAWASAGVTLKDLSEGRNNLVDVQPWYEDMKDRTVVLAHRGVGLALELADDVNPKEMLFPLILRPKEIIKWAVIGCDPSLILRQPFRQATCRVASTVGLCSALRAIQAPRATNSLSSEILLSLAGSAFVVGRKEFKRLEWGDAPTIVMMFALLFVSAAELWGNFLAGLTILMCTVEGRMALVLAFIVPVVCVANTDVSVDIILALRVLSAVIMYYIPAVGIALIQAIHGPVWYPGTSGILRARREDGLCHLGAGSGCGVAFRYRLLLREVASSIRVPREHYDTSVAYYDGRPTRDHRRYQVVALGGKAEVKAQPINKVCIADM